MSETRSQRHDLKIGDLVRVVGETHQEELPFHRCGVIVARPGTACLDGQTLEYNHGAEEICYVYFTTTEHGPVTLPLWWKFLERAA